MILFIVCPSMLFNDACARMYGRTSRREKKRKERATYLLIHQTRQKLRCRHAHALIVPPECSPKLQYYSLHDQLAKFWKLCIRHGDQRGEDRTKLRRRHLRFHHRSSKQTFTSHYIFAKQFRHDVFHVRRVDFVHQSVDGFFERFPRDSLVLWTRCIPNGVVVPHHLREFKRRHVRATRATTTVVAWCVLRGLLFSFLRFLFFLFCRDDDDFALFIQSLIRLS